MKLKRIATLAGVTALLIAGCGAGSPTSSKEQAPGQKRAETELVTPLTDWQQMKLPSQTKISYRLVKVTSPRGQKFCLLQGDDSSGKAPTMTLLDTGSCGE